MILGGTAGIGLATALALKEQGANVVVAGRSAENIERASAAGLDARPLDVLDREAKAALKQRSNERTVTL